MSTPQTKVPLREHRQVKFELERAKRALKTAKERADRLEQAIREHHRQVVDLENWGADDDLWQTLRIGRRPETYTAERRVAA